MEKETNRERLIRYAQQNYITDEQVDFIMKLCGCDPINKKTLLEMVNVPKEDLSKIDTAYPQDVADRCRQANPNWNGSFHVYDYRKERIFGEMTNTAEEFVMGITKIFER